LVRALKYGGRRRLASRLAEELFSKSRAAELIGDDALLVPVPLHGRRRRRRGFNQAELLARALGRLRGVEVVPRALRRRVDTPSQTGLTAAGRRRNVVGAFVVDHPRRVMGRCVVLVDDVYTTGATARACATALKRAGAREVGLLTLAWVT
jgi:ComF family protein